MQAFVPPPLPATHAGYTPVLPLLFFIRECKHLCHPRCLLLPHAGYMISLFYSICAYVYFLGTKGSQFDLGPFKEFWSKRILNSRKAKLAFDQERWDFLVGGVHVLPACDLHSVCFLDVLACQPVAPITSTTRTSKKSYIPGTSTGRPSHLVAPITSTTRTNKIRKLLSRHIDRSP